MDIEASTRAAAIDRNSDIGISGIELNLLDVLLQLVVQLMKSQTSLVDGDGTASVSVVIGAGTGTGVISSSSSYGSGGSQSSSDMGRGVRGAGVGGGGLSERVLTCSSVVTGGTSGGETGSSAVVTRSDGSGSVRGLVLSRNYF